MESSGLISNVNGKYQYQSNLLTNTPNLIKVLVEDEVDVVVWYKILKKIAPEFDYQISPYSFDATTKGKGKANVLKFAGSFEATFIGCVDSDFDWLLENWTSDGQTIKGNDYILQTYAYSIENLASQPYGNSDCMLECVMHSCELQRNLDKDYSAFINSLSSSVYEVLLWHLLMWKDQIHVTEIVKGWEYVFGNVYYKDILDNLELSIEGKRIDILERLRYRAAQRVAYYNMQYSGLLVKRDSLKLDLSARYGLSPDNAYLFVRGHDLHDFLTYCFFKPVKDELIKLHHAEIVTRNEKEHVNNVLNQYKKNRKNFDIDYLYKVTYLDDKTNGMTQAITADIDRIFHP